MILVYCCLATREKRGTNKTWPEALQRISQETIQGGLGAKLHYELVCPSQTQSFIRETFSIFILNATVALRN